MSGYARGEKRPAAEPLARQLEDAHGQAARKLDRMRRLARVGAASAADLLAAQQELAQAVAALELHSATSAYRRKPTADHWQTAKAAALAALTAGGNLPRGQAQQSRAALALLLAQGVNPLEGAEHLAKTADQASA